MADSEDGDADDVDDDNDDASGWTRAGGLSRIIVVLLRLKSSTGSLKLGEAHVG